MNPIMTFNKLSLHAKIALVVILVLIIAVIANYFGLITLPVDFLPVLDMEDDDADLEAVTN